MESSSQPCDVCIVCALPEEARAVLAVLRAQSIGAIEEQTSPRYGYSARLATITNGQGEPLTLHLSWLPRYGPAEMTLHLSRVLEECQPRMAVMTGICAGDAARVQLGDLVVAERTFTYDNGKYALDEDGRTVHLHDTLTYQLDANILQFLGVFDKWQPLVARLRRPPSPPELRRRKVACHLKAMASGSAVRADAPFAEVRAPVRGTVAIDMEGAAFGLVMSRHPHIPWLIVKGVSDYADQAKNDAYHDYAARASALYALSFLCAYLTGQRLPPREGPSARSQSGPEGVWNVPYRRNPHFTGRDELLGRLEKHLVPAAHDEQRTPQRVALTQPQAITGLGGIGKTQLAVEYAYRSRERGRYTHTLWINAASEETIIASFVELAADVLPASVMHSETDQRKLVAAIRRWLERCEQPWLLIFDNVDEPSMVEPYLPRGGNGSILLTTRAHAVGSLATSVEVETMGFVEGTHLLLRRAQRFERASDEEVNQAGNIVVVLDHFPLALDQAGAYIEETQCSFEDYLALYRTHRQALLAQRGKEATNYPHAVATTWSLSFQKVQQKSPAAAELLELCSFLAPDRIPEELLRDGAAYWPAALQQAVADPLRFQQLIADLLKFSLVKRLVEEHALSIHRLVQAVQLDTMELAMQRHWAERVVQAVSEVFPGNPKEITRWQRCLRYLDQAQACSTLIKQHKLPLIEGVDLLNRTGFYVHEHALYSIAEPLYQQALTICKQQSGTTHPNTATVLNNLALLYQEQGKYAKAEPLLKRALLIREQQLGASHPETALSLNNLGTLYRNQGKYAKAEPLLERALLIREQQLGASHPETALSLNTLAGLYCRQGKYSEAEPLLERALAIYEQQLGATHPEISTALNNLAGLYYDQARYSEAEPLLERALLIREQQLGASHPETATSLNDLALLYQEQGKYSEAEPLLERALAIYEQQLGATHPSASAVLNNLALLYQEQGKHAKAEPLLERALLIREQQLGTAHPETALSLNNLALCYRNQGKYAEAKPLYRRALMICERVLDQEHHTTCTVRKNYASLLQIMGRDVDAEKLEGDP
jgi:tetratricopeptide (TPR) repeat protein/nucleoside phosphorylase